MVKIVLPEGVRLRALHKSHRDVMRAETVWTIEVSVADAIDAKEEVTVHEAGAQTLSGLQRALRKALTQRDPMTWPGMNAAKIPPIAYDPGGFACVDPSKPWTEPDAKVDPLDVMAAAPARRPGLPLLPAWAEDEKTDPAVNPPFGPGASGWDRTRGSKKFRVVRTNARARAVLVEQVSTRERKWLRDDGKSETDIAVRYFDSDHLWKPDGE